jgi:hypothetical protein
MRLPLALVSILPWLLAACGNDEDVSRARAAKPVSVECALTRVSGGKKAAVKVTIPILKDAESVESSDGLDAFQANYSFTASISGGNLDILLFENKHVQDEVGGISCGEIPKKKGVFCTDDILVDKNLGSGSEQQEQVKAFTLSCKRL